MVDLMETVSVLGSRKLDSDLLYKKYVLVNRLISALRPVTGFSFLPLDRVRPLEQRFNPFFSNKANKINIGLARYDQ